MKYIESTQVKTRKAICKEVLRRVDKTKYTIQYKDDTFEPGQGKYVIRIRIKPEDILRIKITQELIDNYNGDINKIATYIVNMINKAEEKKNK